MPLNPNIISGLRQPSFAAPDPVEQYSKGLQLKGLMTQQETQDRALADDTASRTAFQSSGGDMGKYLQSLASSGNYKAYAAAAKQKLEQDKAGADLAHIQAQTGQANASADKSRVDSQIAAIERVSSILSTAKDPASYAAARQTIGKMLPQALANLPEQYDPMLVQSTIAGGMKRSEQLKAEHDASTAAETARHNKQGEGETNRHNTADERNKAAQLAQADRHFNEGQNTPQYIETESGMVALPKKLKPGQAPTATMVTAPGGEPLGKPLKPIPPSVNGAIIQNTQSLNQINRALALVGGNDIGDPAKGGQIGDKSATGWKGYLPQSVLNRADPQGVDTRAEIADIGSLKIHDRSGAAVTVSEAPRLMPFIPQATDDAATVKKKLTRLRTEIQNEANALSSTYSKEQGYKPSPVKAAGGVVDLHAMPSGGNGGGKQVNFNDLK